MTRGDPRGLPGRLLTAQELCDRFRVSRTTLWRLRGDGLPSLRVGAALRFDLEAVQRWLASAETVLAPGTYCCRGCGWVGCVTERVALHSVICPRCQRRADVEPVAPR